MRKIIIPLIAIATFIIVGSILGYLITSKNPKEQDIDFSIFQIKKSDKKAISIGDTQVFVDVADTIQERQLGLSGRKKLGKNEGMLFVFEKEDTQPSIWMKEMEFTIDIIWINDDKVIQIDQDVPIPKAGTTDKELEIYKPYMGIDYVLEVNAGFAQKHGIVVGDSIDLSEVAID